MIKVYQNVKNDALLKTKEKSFFSQKMKLSSKWIEIMKNIILIKLRKCTEHVKKYKKFNDTTVNFIKCKKKQMVKHFRKKCF